MSRSRYFRLKLLLLLVGICTYVSYVLKNTYADREQSPDNVQNIRHHVVNITINVSPNELQNDLEYLAHELDKIKHVHQTSGQQEFKVKMANARNNIPGRNFSIVEYTNVFFKPKFCSKSSYDIFNSDMEKCQFQNCIYTCDKEFVERADALIFHQRDLESELEEKFDSNFNEWLKITGQLPFKSADEKLKANREQIWILWNDEATSVNPEFNKISHLFNWTLSYRTSSEIYRGSYGFFVSRQFAAEPHVQNEQLASFKKEIYDNFKRRQNAILWFVSNCKTKFRIQMAIDISRYYPVHIYGKCDWSKEAETEDWLKDVTNKEKHPNLSLLSTRDDECPAGSICEEVKMSSYKYYLAFENNNCSDYITEKLWRSLSKHIIPIILQPNRDSYVRYKIPNKSIIHLQDFNYNARLLSKYLLKIDASFQLYYDHLKWTFVYLKAHYLNAYLEPHRMCELCKMLNSYKSNMYYERIADFFNSQCYSK